MISKDLLYESKFAMSNAGVAFALNVLISKKPLLSSSASKKSGNSCVFALVLK